MDFKHGEGEGQTQQCSIPVKSKHRRKVPGLLKPGLGLPQGVW